MIGEVRRGRCSSLAVGPLADELQVQNDRLKRPITIAHDDRVLAKTFTRLEEIAAQKTKPLGTFEMDVDLIA